MSTATKCKERNKNKVSEKFVDMNKNDNHESKMMERQKVRKRESEKRRKWEKQKGTKREREKLRKRERKKRENGKVGERK